MLLKRDREHYQSPFLDGHSPLTAASKYRHKQLVDVFLQSGAEIKYLTNGDASALHECLYSWEEMCSDNSCGDLPRTFSERERSESCLSSEMLSNLVDVARSLIRAGAEVNDESGFCFTSYGNCTCDTCDAVFLYCTTLDLSLLTGSAELVEMMLCAGAYTTTKISIEYAIRIGSLEIVSRLVNIGAPISIEAIGSLMENKETCSYAITLIEKRPNIRIKRAIFQQAIRLGTTSIIEFFLNTETCNLQTLTYNMTEAFEECCAEGDLDTLRLLTNSSTSNFSISPWKGRSIELAIENGHDDILDILLLAGPDIDVIVHSESVLLAALRKKNTRMIKKIIEVGVSLNKGKEDCSQCKGRHKSNDVFIAAIELGDYQVINKLLDAGASLRTLGATSRIPGSKRCILPLTAAIVAKDSVLVKHFISSGAALNNPPEATWATPTPLSTAVANQDLELVSVLIQRGSNPYDSAALVQATHDFSLLQTLLLALHNFKEPYGYALGPEALHKAIETQNLAMAQAILGSPLWAVKRAEGLCYGLIHAVLFDSTPNCEMIRTFLSLVGDLCHSSEAKFDLDDYFRVITTAICKAIIQNDSRKVELLLEACGCVGERKTKDMDRLAIYCAISEKNSVILRKLLEYGLDPNLPSETSRKTPLERATETRNVEIIKILLQYGANPNTSFDELSHTPLQIASRYGSREAVELLLENGADVNSPPAKRHGATALQFAAIKGLLGIAFILLENGADVNAPPAEVGGRTALEGAAECGRIDMVQLLLNAGASVFQEGRVQYENAVRRASENGHSAVRMLLESHHG